MSITFGEKIRNHRVGKTELSLRKLAEMADISPTYLSRIENDKEPPPSEDIIIRVARQLGMDEDELLSFANKIDPAIQKAITDVPELPRFLRSVNEFDNTLRQEIMGLVALLHERQPKKSTLQILEKIMRAMLDARLSDADLKSILSFIQDKIIQVHM